MIGMTAVMRYMRALAVTAETEGVLQDINEDIEAIQQILEGAPEIADYCERTDLAASARMDLVKLAFGPYVHVLTERMLQIIADNNRLAILPLLSTAFNRIKAETADRVMATLETVQPADDKLMQHVSSRMHARLGKEIVLENKLNPNLLGGYRILWDDRVIDDSATARLRAMSQQLGAIG